MVVYPDIISSAQAHLILYSISYQIQTKTARLVTFSLRSNDEGPGKINAANHRAMMVLLYYFLGYIARIPL